MSKSHLIGTIATAVVTATIMSSCATIVAGGSPEVTINGDTKKPVTIVTEKQTYPNVTLPYTVKVKRHKIEGQRIQIKADSTDTDTEYRDIVLSKKVNSWTFGNIMLGGLIGWGVDLITNCVSTPSTTNYYIEKKEK